MVDHQQQPPGANRPGVEPDRADHPARRGGVGRTTIVVTTSPALLAVTDRVVFLDGAGAARACAHAELVAASAGYRATVLA